jgi:glycine cleavage system transcriptional repressor
MLTEREILSTLEMLRSENLDVRTVTLGVSLFDCSSDDPGLFVHLAPVGSGGGHAPGPSEPFVITTVGPDRPGLVAGIAGLLARYGANITNLKAVSRGARTGPEYVTFYEVDIPAGIDRQGFRAELRARAGELGLDVNLQHREIFEQVHRV